jgi:Serine aminopeptidase, S33
MRAGVSRIAAVLLLVAAGTLGCSADSYSELNVQASEVDGPGTIGLTAEGQPVNAIAVYFHGADQTVAVLQDSAKHKGFFAPFLQDGFAVVAADADGNAYGNPESRDEYRSVIRAAEQKYNAKATVFVAESMGALAALALLGEDRAHQVKGMVGITPLMGVPPYIRTTTFIADQWGGKIPDAADPLSWSPDVFAGKAFRLYEAEQDHVIPRAATAADFAAKFAGVANVEVLSCQGGHVDASCYQGVDVKQWLAGLG